ncbi:MAG: NAD(P)-binding protein [Gemmatimonadetes bacterium]|nr:NAD(P)-binding protein [Gemmatimonadota bacterium]NIO31693.1 NAD(P)-binding protein [Gemmatimonadota bacterium]
MSNELEGGISRKDFLKLVAASTAALAFDPLKLDAMAAGVGSRQHLPVVVIGGGLGGLSAAASLARSGFSVTLVEQHIKPGGYATTFQRGPFDFDVSLHQTASAQEGLRATLEATGVLGKVETVETPELVRIITPDHDLLWPQRDPDAVVEQLAGLFPDEEEGVRGFFDLIDGILEEGLKEFDPESWLSRVAFPLTHRKMWAVRNKTLAAVLDEHVHDERLRAILSSFWPYYGLPPSSLSGFYYCIATAGYLRFGGHYIRNRSQDLSNALMEAIESAGGRVMLGTKASFITLENGSVSGVTLSDGTHLPAMAIISNASVPATMEMLGAGAHHSDEGREYLERLDSYRPALSSFVVWLGLNQEIRGTVDGYEIFVLSGYDSEKAYETWLACDPVDADFGVTIYDNAFEGYSQPGTSTVAVLMLSGYEPWRQYEADYFAGRKDAYNAEKERIAGILIQNAEERVIPGLSSMIDVIEIGTPLTNRRYTGNPQGAIYGYEQSLANAFMTRLPNTTPFAGLYLASAWTNPGGGYQPCLQSGTMAAQRVMSEWEVEI